MSRKIALVLAAGLMFVGVSATVVGAEDKPAASPTTAPAVGDATGTWTWQYEGRNGEMMDVTLKLKQEGEKLTGTITGFRGQETEISDGTIKNGEIAFKVVRTWNDNEIVTQYSGKLEGDVIKGKSEMERNGQTRTREFEAKRAGVAAARDPAGEVGEHMRIAVTGAFGYSGKYMAQRLIAAGHDVLTLTNSPNRPNPFGPWFRLLGSTSSGRTCWSSRSRASMR